MLNLLDELTRLVPQSLPSAWRCVDPPESMAGESLRYWHDGMSLSVIITLETNRHETWMHVSCAHIDRVPGWETVWAVRDIFIGRGRQCSILMNDAEREANPHCVSIYRRLIDTRGNYDRIAHDEPDN